ncbi:MAG: SulP family inorganic anion transporter [Deltaproteobacteria bacterium]|nr:SulP family inorganic anion transporter [Deltaproteobacteria bacterium]
MSPPPEAPLASRRNDLTAGIVVFLVALPLCLGIALASGAPLVGGLVGGIVGGIVVGLLSASEVSVSGPAAGLAVLVASAIADLGSFEALLTAVVLSGALQLVFAALRLGVIADYVPTTVIRGMLAAIGIVIVLKQIPYALGRDSDYEGDFSFLEPGGKENTLSAIAKAVSSASPGAIGIAVLSMALLLAWEKAVVPRHPRATLVPGALLVVVLGVGLNEALKVLAPSAALQATDGHLVSLPTSLGALRSQVASPSLHALTNPKVYTVAVTVAVVGSLETLLSLEAARKLDPYRRIASPTRELFAQGIGNILSGMLGGLPVTSVIVRTSANVYAGGRTRWSAIVHALLLLFAVVALPRVLLHIPLASLAVILIVIGAKLAPPSLFRSIWREGWTSALPFYVTVVTIVFTSLLEGVLFGIAVSVFLVIRNNHHAAMTMVSEGHDFLLRFNKDLTFVNKAELRANLDRVPHQGTLLVDATRALFVDRDVFDVLDDFIESAKHKGIQVELRHFHGKRPEGGA